MTIKIEYLGGGPDPLDVPISKITWTKGEQHDVPESIGRRLIEQGLFREVAIARPTPQPAPVVPISAPKSDPDTTANE